MQWETLEPYGDEPSDTITVRLLSKDEIREKYVQMTNLTTTEEEGSD